MAFLTTCSRFAGAACAQNSVTLYGIFDEGLDYTNNVGGKTAYAVVKRLCAG